MLNSYWLKKFQRLIMGFAAAEKAANRIIETMDTRFEELKNKAIGLEQQLTDISKRVSQISDQLIEIDNAVRALKERVVV